jgi:pilus assembly protein Flp/PilA
LQSLLINLLNTIRRIADGERGASLVEYALLIALIGVVCIGAVSILGQHASTALSSAGSAI